MLKQKKEVAKSPKGKFLRCRPAPSFSGRLRNGSVDRHPKKMGKSWKGFVILIVA